VRAGGRIGIPPPDPTCTLDFWTAAAVSSAYSRYPARPLSIVPRSAPQAGQWRPPSSRVDFPILGGNPRREPARFELADHRAVPASVWTPRFGFVLTCTCDPGVQSAHPLHRGLFAEQRRHVDPGVAGGPVRC
jgi:hypothetical protein